MNKPKHYTLLDSPLDGDEYVLVKDWDKKHYPYGFGGENHDNTKCESAFMKKVYLKSDVDRYIAELKEKLKKARLKLKKVK